MSESLNNELKTLKMIWLAMAGSVLIYLVIALMKNTPERVTERSDVANLIWLFGIGFVAMGFVLPQILLKNAPPKERLILTYIVKYALFETIAVCALVNFLTLGVSFSEAAIGFVAAFALILISKPRI